uniref:CSON014090 protein n=1 Tax=Culicoides sonorensis TaxID=179676 RepID=A0A336MDN0_CULSO
MKTFRMLSVLLVIFLINYGNACEYKEFAYKLSSISNKNTFMEVKYQYPYGGPLCTVYRNDVIVQQIQMDDNLGTFVERVFIPNKNGFEIMGNDRRILFEITVDTADFVEFNVFRNLNNYETNLNSSRDCISLDNDNVHWYGGPEQNYQQYWPIEKQKYDDYDYIPKELDYMAIAERYWLNSKGSYIYFSFDTPLFVTQIPNKSLCLSAEKKLPYNTESSSFVSNYFIGVGQNPKETHLKAIELHLKKPSGIPDERMATHPIWSTWARYKRDIDEKLVEDFADEIIKNGFDNSQIEIDDFWEECYGSLTVNKTKFPDMKGLVNKLKNDGFRVTLWIHPFINKDCQPYYDEAINEKYVVFDHKNNPDTKWWNSDENQAAYIDFTKEEASKWFIDRLHKLKDEYGFDSFKFDAGETSWAPSDPVLQGDKSLHPALMTTNFCRDLSQFGSLLEVRTGWGTQDLPNFVRMLDKDTYFELENNGLHSLVTTLLVMNMNGYPFVLPDMIGGNGYNARPGKELFIRWLEANVFMPSIQFSYVPWDYDEETIEISKKLTKLHEQVATPAIIEAMNKAVQDGTPVNPPIWWIAPESQVALGVGDQFLLGEKIMVAPILKEGETKRDIYLPSGSWKDGNGETYTGNQWIKDYPAPLGTIPYFSLQTTFKVEL